LKVIYFINFAFFRHSLKLRRGLKELYFKLTIKGRWS